MDGLRSRGYSLWRVNLEFLGVSFILSTTIQILGFER